MPDPKKQKKLDKQYNKKVKAKTKQSSKERGITGKEARLRARRAKLSSKAMGISSSLEKGDRLLAKDEKLGKKLRSKRAKEKSNNSPANFTAGVMAGVGGLGGESAYDFTQGQGMVADTARRLAAMNKQRRLPNGVMNAAQAPPTTVGSQDPLNDFSGQKFELTPVQMKNENYIPGNEQGNAKPLFADKTKQVADGIFGKQIPGTFDSALPKKNCNKKY